VVLIFISNGKCLSVITGIDKHQKLGMIQLYQIYTGIVKCCGFNMASTTVTYTLSGLPTRKSQTLLGPGMEVVYRLTLQYHVYDTDDWSWCTEKLQFYKDKFHEKMGCGIPFCTLYNPIFHSHGWNAV